jgi:maltose/moltooligosaccharide transporter
MIGLGTICGTYIASLDLLKVLPGMSSNHFISSNIINILTYLSNKGATSMHIAFYLCAIIYFLAVMITVLTCSEYPPDDADEVDKEKSKNIGEALNKWFKETFDCYTKMPPVMKRLALVQFFTWMGLFCLWIFYNVAVAHYVFGATDPNTELYDNGIRWGTHTMIIKGVATPIFALCIPLLVSLIGKVYTHMAALLICGIGLLTVPFIHDKYLLYFPMITAGIAWASIVSLPYVILVDHIPKKQYGIFMGIFNMFIVIPEILVSIGIGRILMKLVHNNQSYAVAFGGILIIIAAIITPSLNQFEGKKSDITEESEE